MLTLPSVDRKPMSRARRGSFTLIELLVVVAIISILAALLLPSLKNAREAGKRIQCLSNMKQIHLILMMYSNDNDGWFPPVYWAGHQAFVQNQGAGYASVDDLKTGASWIPKYLANSRKILLCPKMAQALVTNINYGASETAYPNYVFGTTTYFIYASTGATGGSPSAPFTFYGHYVTFGGSTPTSTTRVACPNIDFCGRSITGYNAGDDLGGPVYIPPADQMPAVLDAFNPDSHVFTTIFGSFGNLDQDNNHLQEAGENIVFVDGHGEWRLASKVQARSGAGYAPYW